MKIEQFAGRHVLEFGGKPRPFLRGLVMALCAVSFLSGSAQAQASKRFALPDSVNPRVFQAKPNALGALPSAQPMSLAISLPLHNEAKLDALVEDLYTPGSPSFHQWLTTAQFVAQYGPTQQDVAQVTAFAQKHGLTVTKVHDNNMIVDVTGPVSAVSSAFNVNMKTYQHPSEVRTFFAPDAQPTVESGVPILAVGGLDNFDLPQRMMQAVPVQELANAKAAAGSGPSGLYRGKDFRAAYYPKGGGWTGSGQSIALLEAESVPYASDLTSYDNAAGLPALSITYKYVDGMTGTPTGDTEEQALDVDMAHAMAPGAKIVYYLGNNPYDILNKIVSDNTCKTMSSSWSWAGLNATTVSNILKEMSAQGQSGFDASGDGGFNSATYKAAGWGDNPYWTIVGGTNLTTTGTGGPYASETGWSSSGGYISTIFACPGYQTDVLANGASSSGRNTPDVAMVASNIWIVANNGTAYSVGGTSCAAPLWAAFVACANQEAAADGVGTAGFINPAVYDVLYGSGAGTASQAPFTFYPGAFHDITSGNNGEPCGTGYDLVTGAGSPKGQGTMDALINAPSSGFTYGVIARNSGLGLNVNGGGTGDGSTLIQWPGIASSNSQWIPSYVGNGDWKIIGAGSGRAINVPGSSVSQGTQLIIWDYSGTSNELVTLSPQTGGFYDIAFVSDGQMVNVSGNSNSAGAPVIQWDYEAGGYNENWCFYVP